MNTMNTKDFAAALERAGKFKGEPGVVAQKKLILQNYMIVDENGLAVDPESIDITISPAAPAEEMQEDSMTEDQIEDKIAKGIRSALVSGKGGVAPLAVTAEPKAWESARQYGKLKAFKTKESAYRFGSFLLGAMGHQKSAMFCKNNGIHIKAHTEGVNSAGGVLVPDEFENEIVTLREQYGVFRRNAKIYPMGSDTLRVPKRAAGLTAYFVGEANAGTESTQTLDSVNLVAKKLMCLTTVSNELLEDAIVNIGDDVAYEIAYQFSFKEDSAGFMGDGTSTYGGIVGLDGALTDTTYQVSDGGATTYSGVTLAELNAAFRKLPRWAMQRSNVKVFCSQSAYYGVFHRLAQANGGATATEFAAGIVPKVFGFDVEFTQAIPVTESGGATYAFIGDLSQACFLGDRRATSVKFSDSALNAFEQDELVVRGTQRFDIVCANVGGATASGAIIKLTL